MYDFVKAFKLALAALVSAFGGSWAALAGLAAALKVDVASGKQVLIAAVASAVAAIAMWVGNLVKQWREKARGFLNAGSPEAVVLLSEAQALIDQAAGILK